MLFKTKKIKKLIRSYNKLSYGELTKLDIFVKFIADLKAIGGFLSRTKLYRRQ